MRSCWKDYCLIFSQALIYVHRDLIQIAKWRHGSHFTIGEKGVEFLLVCQADHFCSQDLAHASEIDPVRGRQDHHDRLAISEDEDHFRNELAREMLAGSDILRCERNGVLHHLIKDLLIVKVFL